MQHNRLIILALAVLALALMAPDLLAPKASEDLLALWLAGMSLAADRPDLVYAASEPVFSMRPPSAEWLAMARDLGREGLVYPYIYPPLWAALVAPLTERLDFTTIAAIAGPVNMLLLLGCSWLAWRATRSPMPVAVFVLLGQILFYGSTVGAIAVVQNQPQILVAFLVVLAIERSRADSEIAAGTALALAAAIKLYPALFAPILLVTGQRRAFAAFLAVGAGLALVSVGLVGWPLHTDFLAAVRALAGTILPVSNNFGVDAVLTRLLVPAEAMTRVEIYDLAGLPQRGWSVIARPDFWAAAGRFAGLAALAFVLHRARTLRGDALYGRLWPAALTGLTLLLPLAWSYYFIAPLAFAPSLLSRYGARAGGALLFAIFLPISTRLLRHTVLAGGPLTAGMLSALGLTSMMLLLAVFAFGPKSAEAQNGRTTLPE